MTKSIQELSIEEARATVIELADVIAEMQEAEEASSDSSMYQATSIGFVHS